MTHNLVQVRSNPWNRLSRRHPGRLMIPIRLGEGAVDPQSEIFARPDDFVGFEVLFDTNAGAALLPTISLVASEVGAVLRWRIGFENTIDSAFGVAISTSTTFTSGIYIRGSTASPANVLGVGVDQFPLGFDPFGVRLEILIEAEITTPGGMEVTAVVVNGVDIFVGPATVQSPLFTSRLNGVSSGTGAGGSLYHWQFERLFDPSPLLIRFFCEEGPGNPTIGTEVGDDPATVGTMTGVEDTDWQWVDNEPPPDPLDPRPNDVVGLRGLNAGTGYRAFTNSKNPTAGAFPGVYRYTVGIEVGPDPVQTLFGSTANDTGIRWDNAAGGVRHDDTFGAKHLVGNPAWINFAEGTRLEIEIVCEKRANFDSVDLSVKVNGVEATFGLDELYNHNGNEYNQLGTQLGGPANLSRGTIFYALVEFNGGQLDRFGLNEGSGTVFVGEDGQGNGSIDVGTEGVDFEWESPPLLVGLVNQLDVNTRGRVDDAPYEHVNGALGVNQNGATVGSPGDGGQEPMGYSGLANQHSTIPASNLWSGGDGAFCCRWSTVQTLNNGSPIGRASALGSASTSFRINHQGNQGLFACGVFNDAAGSILPAGGAGLNDGVEHVSILNREGDTWTLYVDNVQVDQIVSALGTSFTFDNHSWGAVVTSGVIQLFQGDVFWSAEYDRALPTDDRAALQAVPNPFLDFPSEPPGLETSPRPDDLVGSAELVTSSSGWFFTAGPIDTNVYPVGAQLEWRYGAVLLEENTTGAAVHSRTNENSGHSIRGSTSTQFPDSLTIGVDASYPLGFDPTGVRLEVLVRATIAGDGRIEVTEAVVNDVDVFVPGEPTQIAESFSRIGGSTGSSRIKLYHWQFAELDSGDIWRYLLEEGSGEQTTNEPDDPATLVGDQVLEGVAFEWVDDN